MLKLNENYSDYVEMTDASYPEGKAINASSSESFDGTPLLAEFMNDINAAHIAMYEKAHGNRTGITGNADSQTSSQFADAVEKLVDDTVKSHADERGLADSVHGATSEATPGQIASRDANGCLAVAEPIADGDAVNLSKLNAVVDTLSPLAGSSSLTTCSEGSFASGATKTAGSAIGNVPVIGTALGTTDNNIVVTDASGNLKPSGTVIGSAAGKTAGAAVGNVPLVGEALGTTNNKIVVTDASGNLKPAAYTCGAASAKGVDTTASTTSTNVPTTAMAISSGNAGAVCSTAASTQIKAITLSGFALYSGVTVKVMFTLGNSSDNPRLKINSLADKAIMVVDAGAKKAPVNHTGYWRGETSTRPEMWQPYTILELMYDGTDFVIMGNPTVESWHNDTSGYEVKANGLIKQYLTKKISSETAVNINTLINFSSKKYNVSFSQNREARDGIPLGSIVLYGKYVSYFSVIIQINTRFTTNSDFDFSLEGY